MHDGNENTTRIYSLYGGEQMIKHTKHKVFNSSNQDIFISDEVVRWG